MESKGINKQIVEALNLLRRTDKKLAKKGINIPFYDIIEMKNILLSKTK